MESNVNSVASFSGSTLLQTGRLEAKETVGQSTQGLTSSDKVELAQKLLEADTEKAKADERQAEEQDKPSVERVVQSVNKFLEAQDRDVKFIIDERDGQYFTSVLNRSTDELIREIPTEEFRQLEERLKNFQDAIGETTGLFVDQLV